LDEESEDVDDILADDDEDDDDEDEEVDLEELLKASKRKISNDN
jgi:hypothetical protein